jgi:hypothetical protein
MRNDGIRQDNAFAIYNETIRLFVFIILSVRGCTRLPPAEAASARTNYISQERGLLVDCRRKNNVPCTGTYVGLVTIASYLLTGIFR